MNLQHKKYLKLVDDLLETAKAYSLREENHFKSYITQLSSRLSKYIESLDKLKAEIDTIDKIKQMSRTRWVVVYSHNLKEDSKKTVNNGDGTTTTPCYWQYEYVGIVEIQNGLLTIDQILEDVSVTLDINIALQKQSGPYAMQPILDRVDDKGDKFIFIDGNRMNGPYVAAIGYDKDYTIREMKDFVKTNNTRR